MGAKLPTFLALNMPTMGRSVMPEQGRNYSPTVYEQIPAWRKRDAVVSQTGKSTKAKAATRPRRMRDLVWEIQLPVPGRMALGVGIDWRDGREAEGAGLLPCGEVILNHVAQLGRGQCPSWVRIPLSPLKGLSGCR